nr:transposase family protein [Actinomyces qiguomingii]
MLTDSTGYPVWTSPVEPGSVHDIKAARTHMLPALHPVAADGTPTLADKGYVGAGIGIKVPIKGSKPDTGTRSYNQVKAHLQAPAETANALLKGFKALKPVTLDPSTITKITATAQVILRTTTSPDEKGSMI